MLAIYVFFSIIGFVLLGPLVTGIAHFAVSLSGDAALSDVGIASFVLTPLGGVLALAMGALLLTIGVLGYAALLVPAGAAYHDRESTYLDGLAQGGAKAPVILRLALRFIVQALVMALPFLAVIGVIYFVLLRENDINYYLAEKPPEFLWAAGLAACVLVAMGFFLVRLATGWFYVLPLALFRHETVGEARRLSRETVPGRRKEIFFSVALWMFGTPFLVGLLNAPISALGVWLAPRMADRLPLLALSLGLLSLLMTVLAFFVGFVALSLLAVQNVRLYRLDGLDTEVRDAGGRGRAWRLPVGAKSLWVGGVLAFALASFSAYYWINHIEVKDHAVVIGHRGAAGAAPENTMAAILQGVEDGADWIEIDVQETSDGAVLVYHDSDFKRLGGEGVKFWEATAEQVSGIDIGSWFSSEFSGERAPTLKAVLEACRGHCGVLIELKYYGHTQRLEERVAEIVEETEMEDHVMVMSLEYAGIQKMRQIRPKWKLGLLSTVSIGDLTKLDVNFLGLNAKAASGALVQRAHKAGIDVYVWTVNTPVDMSSMLSRGVDGLITDEPALARRVMAQRAEMNPAERLMIELSAVLGKTPKRPEQ